MGGKQMLLTVIRETPFGFINSKKQHLLLIIKYFWSAYQYQGYDLEADVKKIIHSVVSDNIDKWFLATANGWTIFK